MQKPVKLTPARAWRTYIGGSQIDRIHGMEGTEDSHFPEEWIMSTVVARNAGREALEEGMCHLEGSGISLKQFLSSPDAAALLGERHVRRWGTNTGVLVKLIDAAERLTVQVHPDKGKAMELFHSSYGKTECWHVLGGRSLDGEEPSIYMGFKPGITRSEWKRCFDEQDIPALLGHMHHIPVHPGETFLVEGGVPHAIGKGCLLVEIQEPTDYTIRVERVTPNGLKVADQGCHQGLGFERMFDCFHYEGLTLEEVEARWKIPARRIDQACEEVVGYDKTSCFRMERFEVSSRYQFHRTPFCGLYVVQGSGRLDDAPLMQGDQFFVPAGSDFSLVNEGTKPLVAFACYGPQS